MPEQRIRAILAQRPGSGEKQVRKIPAREKRREGQARLPAGTSEAFSAQEGDSLPRRDVVQAWAAFGACRAEILPSGDDVRVQATQRPGLGGFGGFRKEKARLLHNVPAWEKNGRTTSRLGRTRRLWEGSKGSSCTTSRAERSTAVQDHGLGENTGRQSEAIVIFEQRSLYFVLLTLYFVASTGREMYTLSTA